LKDNLEVLLLREKAGEAFAKQEVIVEQDEANSRRFVLASGLHPQNGKCIPSACQDLRPKDRRVYTEERNLANLSSSAAQR
jgi:hypothetical protein